MSPGGIVMSVFVCMLVITLFGWVGYAYFNPNTSSGRFLIKVTHICSYRIVSTFSFISVSSRCMEVATEWCSIHSCINSHVTLP